MDNNRCKVSENSFISFDVSQDEWTALHVAAVSEFDEKEKIMVLIENGANVNIQNKV